MNRTERYLKRATLGLWGRRRREAQMELRGAIEDKLWRFQHLGLTLEEAERRALAELGPARAVAGGLSRVHSLPVGVQGALLVGILGMLGVQVVAAQPAVKVVPYQNAAISCPPDWDQDLCLNSKVLSNSYISTAEMLYALKAVGLDPVRLNVQQVISFSSVTDSYINLIELTQALLNQPTLNLRLQGERNPTLSINGKSLILGTPATPIRDDLIVLAAAQVQLTPRLLAASRSSRIFIGPDLLLIPVTPQRRLSGLASGRYVVISALGTFSPECDCDYQINLRTVTDGSLIVGGLSTEVKAVGTPAELAAAKAKGISAVLLYKLGSVNDLRNLPLSLVNTSKLKIVKK